MNNKVGSSETIRETLKSNQNDINFKYWLIGFTEGDGSFIINNYNKYLEFKITQQSNDAQVLFLIKKFVGFGSVKIQDYKIVNNKKVSKTHHYRVREKKGLLKIIELFNGNLVTARYRLKFNEWVNRFNSTYNEEIKIIDNSLEPSLNNAWLSGFTDAEGCFTISITNRVFVRFILSQKGENELMQKIASLLNGKIHYLPSYDGYNMVVNLLKLITIINYIKKYPLKTKKSLSFKKWIVVYKKIIRKEHLFMDENQLNQLRILSTKINNFDYLLEKIESDQL